MGKKVFKKLSKVITAPARFAAEEVAGLAGDLVTPFAEATGQALGGLTPPVPDIAIPEIIPDQVAADPLIPEDEAELAIKRRNKPKAQSRTLLDTGLGGGQATVGRPTLLGGGA